MDNYLPNRLCRCMRCRSRGIMGPAVLVTLGVLFLLDSFNAADFGRTWPLLLVIIGLVRVFQSNAPLDGHVQPSSPEATPSTGPGPNIPSSSMNAEV